jgi:hypothetical protein
MLKPIGESRNQLRLELEPSQRQIQKIQIPTGAVAALADLLLSAVGVATVLAPGGNDDWQDHA